MNKLKYCPTCGKAMYSEVYYNHITGNSYLKFTCLWCETKTLMNKSKRIIKVKKNGRKY